jgi:hypothetical protein
MNEERKLAERVRGELAQEGGVTEQGRVGGLAFLLHGNPFVGVSGGGDLLVRVPPAEMRRALARPHTEPMMLAGRPRPGWVRVGSAGARTPAQLAGWISLAARHARRLPPRRSGGSSSPAAEGGGQGSATPPRPGSIRDFDTVAMWNALDARRRELGLAWTRLAGEIWDQSSDLNERRPTDHPISPSTLSGMGRRGFTSCQHALAVLRWLGQPPEAFLRAGSSAATTAPLPDCGQDRRLRWNLRQVYAALDAARRRRDLTWVELARELRCTPSQLTGIRKARYAMGMGIAMRVVQWLGRPAADFIHPAKW